MIRFHHLRCPSCQTEFPSLLAFAQKTRRGLFPTWFICSECGTTCQYAISWRRALWIWPLTILAVVALVSLGAENTDIPPMMHEILRVILGLLVLATGFYRSVEMAPIIHGTNPSPNRRKATKYANTVSSLLFVLLSLMLYGLYTKRWMDCLIVVGTYALILIFHWCSKKWKAQP